MIQSAIALGRLCFDMPWSDDLLKASAVFLVAGPPSTAATRV
jgi:hypothetical protein